MFEMFENKKVMQFACEALLLHTEFSIHIGTATENKNHNVLKQWNPGAKETVSCPTLRDF